MSKKDDRERKAREEFNNYMSAAIDDPIGTGEHFLGRLVNAKKPPSETINQLKNILKDPENRTYWQYSSKTLVDAIQFVISNSMMKGWNLGANGRRGPGLGESMVVDVANMISEDIDFDPMTPQQKRMKQIAESYGFSVYLLTEDGQFPEGDDGQAETRPRKPDWRLSSASTPGCGWVYYPRHDYYETGCNNEITLGRPGTILSDVEWVYCPHCGDPIVDDTE